MTEFFALKWRLASKTTHFMKNGNEARDVLSDSLKRHRTRG